MEKKDIIEFFNMCAPEWDADMIRNEEIINIILDNAKVCEGKDVLDVACGTGVLIPDYLARNVNTVTAIDISPEMVKIAKSNHVPIVCMTSDRDAPLVKLSDEALLSMPAGGTISNRMDEIRLAQMFLNDSISAYIRYKIDETGEKRFFRMVSKLPKR